MDYSKLRKIMIILCIVSLVLSISKKVFAVDYNTDNTYTVMSYNQNITLPDIFKDNSLYWVISISNNTSQFAGFNYSITICNKRFDVSSSSNGTLYMGATTNCKLYHLHGQSQSKTLAQIQTWINGLNLQSTFDSLPTTDHAATNILPTYRGGINAANFTVTNSNGDIVINRTHSNIVKPHFDNPQEDFDYLSFHNLFVSLGTYSTDFNLYLKILEVTRVDEAQNPAENVYYYNDLSFTLNNKSDFLQNLYNSGIYYYSIPDSALKLKRDRSYYFILTSNPNKIENSVGELTTSDEIFDLRLVDTANLITTEDEILASITNDNPSDDTNDIINNELPRPGYSQGGGEGGGGFDIPGVNVNIPSDPTLSTFNWIFSHFYNLLNSIEENDRDVVLNFTPYNYSGSEWSFLQLRINPDLTYNLLEDYPNILTLIQSTYYFVICYYVINDIRKYAERVRNGEIMTHTDTNIKAEML